MPANTNPAAVDLPKERKWADPSASIRSGQRRDEIMAVALKLFSDKGYAETSLKDIGEKTGLLAGSLYYHIRSKEVLLYDILCELHTRALSVLETIDSQADTPINRIRLLVRYHAINDDGSLLRLFESEARHLNPERFHHIVEMRRQYSSYLIRLLEQAKADGACAAGVDARATALAMLGFLNSMPNWFRPSGSVSAGQMQQTIERMLVASLSSA